MFNRTLNLTSALAVALSLVWSAGAQPPDQNPAGRARRAGPGGFGAGGGLERIVDDLKLSETKKQQAEAAVKEYQENVRKLIGLARSDLLMRLKDLLSAQEFKQLNDTLDRPASLANARGRRGGGFAGRGLSVDQMVERILSFDKNKDGKISKDELPERMQNLIAQGDMNKDGVLDNEEIKKLASDLTRNGSFRGFGERGPGGRFGAGPGGRVGPGGFPVAAGIERALDDLKLPENKKQTAETAVKAYQDNTRKLTEMARADLLMKMTPVLSDEEFKTFKTALERRPGFGAGVGGRGGRFATPAQPAGDSRSSDLEKKLDQLQQDLNNLRREIRR
jgi:hypothetical protein